MLAISGEPIALRTSDMGYDRLMSSSTCSRIEVIQGDITTLQVDAIVNAANTTLLGGGGVDGAIHRAAGPRLLEECRKLGGCATGDANITGGYNLQARHVIHTVGPVWSGGQRRERELLASCYQRALQLARDTGCRCVAFPAISTGVYGFPMAEAAGTAVAEVAGFLEENSLPQRVVLVCFDSAALHVFLAALRDYQTADVS
jgi:O-acetyl-ADP-ribose deacetylase (regulator of RNase III)